ncbi:uncharacterized protein EKO05_0004219 [Ascochyta rabiei]|uniref:Uncharacterized protein n=1 Tax=Didymella rabiei TaxID=5454 RepID=A0A162XL49_DIDRA|nr:uncharacterized protein EKO05_0004219 [Ascochyta rabiei]KZM19609.1 hypothetical protein ST47_g9102 [Ascochyta rabiei]UPX13720.1 hypothetical protein EKO05_0004219 [Ascochyta rabiei]
MSGELQTIPARHGVATFVPRGRTIKVINIYGKQVVSMWAFTLGPPPEDDDDDGLGAEEVEEEAKKLQEAAVAESKGKEDQSKKTQPAAEEKQESKAEDSADLEEEKKERPDVSRGEESKEHEDPPEQAPDTPDNEKSTEDTDNTEKTDEKTPKQPSKRTWASYLPSIPYRSKGKGDKADNKDAEQEPSPEEQKAQNEANTKKWSSYIPTGKGFSNYIPNVEVPSKEGVVSAFKSSHYRDPNKSYAEQLYDFSKTPVGAGTIAAATGSGYASSVYAAYSAYSQVHPSDSSLPPMEYLSLPHTRASSYKLVPEVDDTLLTNLRNPIITLIEDSTPGAHDTLTAACDANLYTALGVDKPAEHGSCAENLVLALKELNENAGLKGTKAVGADISVNIAPTPLHLFMAAPIELPSDAKTSGSGAKGARLAVEEPQGKKRVFVRFRAERDVVVVFSACPMDVGPQNGGRCMAANFMVEEADGDNDAASIKSKSGKKTTPRKLGAQKDESKSKDATEKKEDADKPKPKKLNAPNAQGEDKRAERKDAETTQPASNDEEKEGESPPAETEEKVEAKTEEKAEEKTEEKAEKAEDKSSEKSSEKGSDEAAKPKKKPKKLQVRSKQ